MAIKLIRGDTWTQSWILKDASNALINLTGAQIRLQARDASNTVVISASLTDGRITVPSPTAGRIDMVVPYTATELPPGVYKYDLEVTFSNGVRKTFDQEVLIILPDVTRD